MWTSRECLSCSMCCMLSAWGKQETVWWSKSRIHQHPGEDTGRHSWGPVWEEQLKLTRALLSPVPQWMQGPLSCFEGLSKLSLVSCEKQPSEDPLQDRAVCREEICWEEKPSWTGQGQWASEMGGPDKVERGQSRVVTKAPSHAVAHFTYAAERATEVN